MKNLKYKQAVENLTEATNIAIQVIKEYPPKELNDFQWNHIINVYYEWKEGIVNPEPKFDNMGSLKYSIDAVFTYFQEDKGHTVDKFWEKIKEANLPYKRENKLAKILKRKRIKDDIEYDFVIDVIIPYQQEGLINEDEVVLLNNLIADFEIKSPSGASVCLS
jgi:hypothetical protein